MNPFGEMPDENMPPTKIDSDGSLIIFSGTENNLDYVMFSMTDQYAIGFKPLLGIGSQSVDFAYRIRAIPYQSPSEDGVVKGDFGVTGENIAGAFPGFNFNKISDKRCSLVCAETHLKDLGANQIKELIAWFKESSVVDDIMETLRSRLGIEKWDDGDAIAAWIKARYLTQLEGIAKVMGVAEQEESATVTNIAEKVSEEDIDAEAADLKAEVEDSTEFGGFTLDDGQAETEKKD